MIEYDCFLEMYLTRPKSDYLRERGERERGEREREKERERERERGNYIMLENIHVHFDVSILYAPNTNSGTGELE